MHRRETSVAWPGYSSAKAMALSVCALSVAWHLPRRVKHYTVTGSPEPHQNGFPVVLAVTNVLAVAAAVTNVLAIAAAVTEPYRPRAITAAVHARGLAGALAPPPGRRGAKSKTCKSTTETQGPREGRRGPRGASRAPSEITDRDPLPDPPGRYRPDRRADPRLIRSIQKGDFRLIGLSFPDYQRTIPCGVDRGFRTANIQIHWHNLRHKFRPNANLRRLRAPPGPER